MTNLWLTYLFIGASQYQQQERVIDPVSHMVVAGTVLVLLSQKFGKEGK